MRIEFDQNTPIYLQLMQHIRQSAVSGQWPPGSKIPSVRDLAVEYGVNPNTVQKALVELERDGLLYSERTAGRYVTSDLSLINALRDEMAGRLIEQFTGQMQALGYEKAYLLKLLMEKWRDEDGHP